MKKIYLDQPIWQYLCEKEPILEFKSKILSKSIEVHIGTGNIYEFGRLLLDRNEKVLLKKIFSYMWEIADILKIVKEPTHLIKDDLIYAKTGGRTLPYLDELNTSSAKQEIFRLSKGYCPEGEKFIRNREEKIKLESPDFIEKVKKSNPKKKKNIKFKQFRDDWTTRRGILQESQYCIESQSLSNSLLFERPQKYPFLNTYINTALYTFYAVLFKNAKPDSYTSDFRHIICANATDCFITNDNKLMNLTKEICPYIDIINWDDFYNSWLV